jgi:hypothetical protein
LYCITKITDQLTILDVYNKETIMRKFLQALSKRFHQITVAIKTLLDLESMSLVELVGRLNAMEERYDRAKGKDGGRTGGRSIGKEIDGKLCFTEEVIACLASRPISTSTPTG